MKDCRKKHCFRKYANLTKNTVKFEGWEENIKLGTMSFLTQKKQHM